MMTRYNIFELRRLSDDTVYQFARTLRADGSFGYRRQDKDLWIIRDPRLGWIAPHPETDEITGKPWNHLPDEQGNYPPEGEWVSKKGAKSYVYQLVYITDTSHRSASPPGVAPAN